MEIIDTTTLANQTFEGLDLAAPYGPWLGEVTPHFQAFIWGEQGSGKSTLAHGLAFALVEHAANENGTVLIVSAEEGPGRNTQQRGKRLGAEHTRLLMSDFRTLGSLQEAIETNNVQFLVIDSATVVDPGTQDGLAFMQYCHDQGVGLILVAHARKDGAYKGDSRFAHQVDVVIRCWKEDDTHFATTTKNRFRPAGERIVIPMTAKAIDLDAGDIPGGNAAQRENPEVPIKKLQDTGTNKPGRVDRSWSGDSVEVDFAVKPWHTDPEKAIQRFGLTGIEFGHWMEEDKRAKFLAEGMEGLNDLSNLLGIDPEEVGAGRLSVAFGARGTGGRAAHYERGPSFTINITKPHGPGSLAHEYAHYIDNLGGQELQNAYASGGRSTWRTIREDKLNRAGVVGAFEELFQTLYYKEGYDGTTVGPNSREGLRSWAAKLHDTESEDSYWERRLEVFARTFEKYVSLRLTEEANKNTWLASGPYGTESIYPPDEVIEAARERLEQVVEMCFVIQDILPRIGEVRENPGASCVVTGRWDENDELNGVEIRFSDVPPEDVRERLKDASFRFHPKDHFWWNEATPENLQLARELAGEGGDVQLDAPASGDGQAGEPPEVGDDGSYARNLETGRIEVTFSKADYEALPDSTRGKIKRYFNFSRSAGQWVSKARKEGFKLDRARRIVQEAGLTDAGEYGDRLPFAEQQRRKTERAEQRQARFEQQAESASGEAQRRFDKAHEMSRAIPFGQPILRGHHSEARDRRFRERIRATLRKGFEAQDRSEHYERRAKAAARTASQEQLNDPAYLTRRVEESKASVRKLLKKTETVEGAAPGVYDDREAYLTRLQRQLSEANDKLVFFQEHLQSTGGIEWTRERVKARSPNVIKYRGSWYPVQRINKKTVTVWNWLGVASMEWRVPYEEIQDVATVDLDLERVLEERNAELPDVGELRSNPGGACVVSGRWDENDELNGVEIRFSDVPPEDVRARLKDHGFRFHPKDHFWWNQATPENLTLARELAGAGGDVQLDAPSGDGQPGEPPEAPTKEEGDPADEWDFRTSYPVPKESANTDRVGGDYPDPSDLEAVRTHHDSLGIWLGRKWAKAKHENRPKPPVVSQKLAEYRKGYGKEAANAFRDVIKSEYMRAALERLEGKPSGATQLLELSLDKLHTDPSRFQPRAKAYSEESAREIFEHYDRQKLDPVRVWKDPDDDEWYILAGHSRLEGQRRRRKAGKPDSDTLPAQPYEGTERQAIRFAHEENEKATATTSYERADYIRRLWNSGDYSLKDLKAKAKSLYGRDARSVVALSFLNEKGKALATLRQMTGASDADRRTAQTMAEWIGKIRRYHRYLTDSHEKELYNFLLENYKTQGKGFTSFRTFRAFVEDVIGRRSFMGEFDTSAPLNFANVIPKSQQETAIDRQIREKQADLREAKRELDRQRETYAAKTNDADALNAALQPYEDDVRSVQQDLIQMREEAGRARSLLEQSETSLFGDRMRENPSIRALARLGTVHSLTTSVDSYSPNDGENTLLVDPQGTTLFVVPAHRIEIGPDIIAGGAIEQMFTAWHSFSPDERDLTLHLPEDTPLVPMGTAVSIEYVSDKVMRAGDRKGLAHSYEHDFEDRLPVYEWGDCLIIEHAIVNHRGIIN